VQLSTHRHLADHDEQLWGLYQRSFEELRAAAVQRHLMTHSEFRAVMTDDRVDKFVVTDDAGRVGAMATMTNELDAVPLIAPEYFAARWPLLYDEKRVWYVGFVAVDPDHQNAHAMAGLIGRMCAEVGRGSGVICVDICRYREAASRLSEVIERQANRFTPGVTRVELDAQLYWGYEFPAGA
jgi:hypothetical protein